MSENEGIEFRFLGNEIDRVISFVESMVYLRNQNIGFTVNGELNGKRTLEPASSSVRLTFDVLPNSKNQGYIRTLTVLDSKIQGKFITVGGENAVMENIALENITFKVNLTTPNSNTKTNNWLDKIALSKSRREPSEQPQLEGTNCLKDFPTLRTKLLEDDKYRLYLLAYLKNGKKLFAPYSWEVRSTIAELACSALSDCHAQRLVHILEDFHNYEIENNIKNTDTLLYLLAEHYPSLGVHFRKYLSRCFKGAVNGLRAISGTRDLYSSILHYVLPDFSSGGELDRIPWGIFGFIDFVETRNVWESFWYLYLQDTDQNYKEKILKDLLADVDTLSKRYNACPMLQPLYADVLASAFYSFGKHLNPGLEQDQDLTEEFKKKSADMLLQIKDSDKPDDIALKLTIIAALGYLGFNLNCAVTIKTIKELLSLAISNFDERNNDVRRVVLHVAYSLLKQIKWENYCDFDEEFKNLISKSVEIACNALKDENLFTVASRLLCVIASAPEFELKKQVNLVTNIGAYDSFLKQCVVVLYEINNSDNAVISTATPDKSSSSEAHFIFALSCVHNAQIYARNGDYGKCCESYKQASTSFENSKSSTLRKSTRCQAYFAYKVAQQTAANFNVRWENGKFSENTLTQYIQEIKNEDIEEIDQPLKEYYLYALATPNNLTYPSNDCGSINIEDLNGNSDHTQLFKCLIKTRPIGLLGVSNILDACLWV